MRFGFTEEQRLLRQTAETWVARELPLTVIRAMADAVGRQVDAAMLVTSERSLHRDTLAGIKQELARFRVKAVGSVFNTGGAR